VWGDQDAFCDRSDQDALLAAIPRARLSIYRGTGHCPHWEQPERAAAEVFTAEAAAGASRRALASTI
jgi:pimeloyl-ACP methyl ester carboxylesterase